MIKQIRQTVRHVFDGGGGGSGGSGGGNSDGLNNQKPCPDK